MNDLRNIDCSILNGDVSAVDDEYKVPYGVIDIERISETDGLPIEVYGEIAVDGILTEGLVSIFVCTNFGSIIRECDVLRQFDRADFIVPNRGGQLGLGRYLGCTDSSCGFGCIRKGYCSEDRERDRQDGDCRKELFGGEPPPPRLS